jgi:ribonuclease VapC
MKKIVIDSSAILALLNQEKGAEIVEKKLDCAIISSVNFSEVLVIAARNGLPQEDFSQLLSNIFSNIVNFDSKQAKIAASLDKITKKHGLSLGDRACLALAKQEKCAVLTADKAWKKLDVGVVVEVIR